MIENKQQTAVEWYARRLFEIEIAYSQGVINTDVYIQSKIEAKQQAKEMEKEQMRLDIEKKWEQYRIITNNEDAWSFKEWLIKQTYGGNK
jgi:cytochrome c-type biogenesis protein CcmH/NrfG